MAWTVFHRERSSGSSPRSFVDATTPATVDFGTAPVGVVVVLHSPSSPFDDFTGVRIGGTAGDFTDAGWNSASFNVPQLSPPAAGLNSRVFAFFGAGIPTGVQPVHYTKSSSNSGVFATIWVFDGNETGIANVQFSSGSTVAGAASITHTGSTALRTVLAGGYHNGSATSAGSGTTLDMNQGGTFAPRGFALRRVAGSPDTVLNFNATGATDWRAVEFEVVTAAPAGPVITGPSTFNLAENDTSSGPLFSTDIGLGAGFPTLTGVDAALFNLVSVGANQWRAVKLVGGNFEAPDDAGANRVYDITFNASASVSRACTITLTNVVELPGAPTIGTATAGNATVTINGTAPAPNGGPSVTGYQATLSPGAITKTSATLPITFVAADGVVNGVAYTGTLRAINSDGTGPASASSNPVTPSTGATATAVTVTPPTPASGSVGVASGAFTVGLNGTLGAGVTRVVTPSAGAGGGSFSPASVSLTDAQPTGTFVYTPASEGAKSITVTNDGALANPAAVTYTVTAPAVTYSATVGPFGGNSGAGQRAAGTAFEAWVFPPGFVLGDAPPTTAPLRIAGTLNASGLAVLTSLPAAGTGEVWFMFPSDPQPAKADRGTARGRYTAA